MGSKKKKRSKNQWKENRANDQDDLAESMEAITEFEQMFTRMKDDMIASLGEGFDDESLAAMDRKLVAHFFPEALVNSDDECEEDEEPQRGPLPTEAEIAHYKESVVKREIHFIGAATHQAEVNSISGEDYKNLTLYETLYRDVLQYRYAWFGIIFQNKTKLLKTSQILNKLAWLKLEEACSDEELSEALEVMQLFDETKSLFQESIDGNDAESCKYAGSLEFDGYHLQFAMAEKLALYSRKDEACQLFQEALSSEATWQYFDRFCGKVLEFAVGRRLSQKDIDAMEIFESENLPEYFYFDCLVAMREGEAGSVPWTRAHLCENCGKREDTEAGKRLLRCARCKEATYCSKECQKEDWKLHKPECGPATR
jgi:MYND finger